ncbi:NADH:flavin oxidoreductase/NADH oxidase [Plectosphaerella plurivora]|uniref:NADH:flavin oxidoreductase/NADH oxidase n=1 Tax=Plectosphaerella plurivora TaxID=936078 RepID=A0A9P8VB89_9PEZI|nr:NADH:flavin oxidoreductase/NADH oxidase [Plectosphaerella plurivora]
MASSNISESRLFKPLKLGNAQLTHRIAMAPLTRFRNNTNNAPLDFTPKYYADRGSTPGTLIMSEATGTSMQETGVDQVPAFVTDEQVASWKKVIAAVHENKSVWFQQLWGLGRGADPEFQKRNGYKFMSSSPVPMKEGHPVPEEMTEAEILATIDGFVATAKRVVGAGGDGVEVHGAHGYLLDQFLSDSVNKRTDKWGGSIENRARLLLMTVKAVVEAIGAEKVGIRLSPYASYQNSESSDIIGQYTYVIDELKKMNVPFAYLSLVEARGDPDKLGMEQDPSTDHQTLDFILEKWDNLSPVVVAGSYTPETAVRAVDGPYKKWDVIVAFGRNFVSNPDLVYRIKHGLPLNEYHRPTFYLKGSEIGYNDYPFSKEWAHEQREAAVASMEVHVQA